MENQPKAKRPYTKSERSYRDIDTVPDEQIRDAVRVSVSFRSTANLLGIHDWGKRYQKLHARIEALSIDTLHFHRSYRKGGTGSGSNSLVPLEKVLKIGRDPTYTPGRLKKRLVDEGKLKDECIICGQKPEWRGQPLTLKLGHINKDLHDNRLENLCVYCPNCHSQHEPIKRDHNIGLRSEKKKQRAYKALLAQEKWAEV